MEQPNSNGTEQRDCEVCGDSFTPDGRRKSRCSKEHHRSCEACGGDFIVGANDKPSKAFCSRSCSNRSRSRVSICPVCGKDFEKRSKTCSRKCANALRAATKVARPEIRSCAYCHEDFESIGGQIYCARAHFDSCEVCGESFETSPGSKRRTCSSLCAGKLINSDDAQEKRRATSRERYGTDFPQQSGDVKEKIAASNFERYGYSSPLGSPELREIGRKSTLEAYGTEWYNQSEIAKKKLIATNLKRYGVPNVFMVPEFQEKAQASLQRRLAEDGSSRFPRISKINRHYAEVLGRELGAEVSFEAPMGSYFADLRVSSDSQEFLIDIHPTVSHNSQVAFGCIIGGCGTDCENHKPIAPSYHQSRARAAMEDGRRLIQWYGWNDLSGLIDLLRPKLQPAKRLSARKLQLATLSQRDANRFLKEFHIQGGARSQSHCYGLFYENELIAVATFGKSRFGSPLDQEFIRYAVRPGFVIYGGAGRLVERFLQDNSGSLVSYVDFDHTTARSVFLLQSGFEEVKPTGPGLIWHRIADGKAVRNSSLLSQGADRLIGTSYGSRETSGLGNVEIMLLEGFLPVHTSGNRVFELRR